MILKNGNEEDNKNNSKVEKVKQNQYIIEEKIKTEAGEKTIRKYIRGILLGKGGFGECYEFKCEKSEKKFACKIIDKETLHNYNISENKNEIINEKSFEKNKKHLKELLKNEIKIHNQLHHPYIVSFEHYFEDNKNVYILLELCQNQTLESLLKRRKRLTEFEVQYYIKQLIRALKYLHKRKIIHRDLKLSNLFINEKMELKLGDFGLAIKLEKDEDKVKGKCGTIDYMAPEILSGISYSYGVDIWSLGVIIYRLITGEFPFISTKQCTKVENIKESNFTFPKDIIISESAKDLIEQILEKKPEKRPSLSQILIHNFFNQARSIPDNLPTIFLGSTPSCDYIKSYIKDVDDKDLIVKKPFEKIKLIDFIPNENEINEDKEGVNYIIKNEKYLKESEICVKKWNDYPKHGLGYLLTNGNYGVFFNDKSKIILNPQTKIFYFLKRNIYDNKEEIKCFNIYDIEKKDDAENENIILEIKSKLKILKEFKKIIEASIKIGKDKEEKEKQEEENKEKRKKVEIKKVEEQKEMKEEEIKEEEIKEEPKKGEKNEEKKEQKKEEENEEEEKEEEEEKPFIHIKKWMKTKHAVFFRLSNKVVQAYFKDDTQIIFDNENSFTYVNKKGERLQYDRELNSKDDKMIKKYNYTKECINHLLDKHLKIKAQKRYQKDY